MSETLDGAGRTIDGVTFLISPNLNTGCWSVGDGDVRTHHDPAQRVTPKNLAAVMDVRPGANEDGTLIVRFAEDLRIYATDALEGIEAHRRGPLPGKPRPFADSYWGGTIMGCVVRTNIKLKATEWKLNGVEDETRQDLTVRALVKVLNGKDKPALELPGHYSPILTALAESEGVDWEATGQVELFEAIITLVRDEQARMKPPESEATESSVALGLGDQRATFGVAGLTAMQAEVARWAIDLHDEGSLIVGVFPEEVDLYINVIAAMGDASLGSYPKVVFRDGQQASQARDHLAQSIQRAREFAERLKDGMRTVEPLVYEVGPRELSLEGEMLVDDLDEATLPEQPIIEGESVARALEAFHGSRVAITVVGPLGTIDAKGILKAHVGSITMYMDRPEYDPPEITVGGLNLLRDLVDMADLEVKIEVIELEASEQSAPSDEPTEDEDLAGKIRMALASAKLMEDVVVSSLLECALKWRADS